MDSDDILISAIDDADTQSAEPIAGEPAKPKRVKQTTLGNCDKSLIYAVCILRYLRCNRQGCIAMSKVFAEAKDARLAPQGIPKHYGEKIIRTLCKNGLVYARRGKVTGGIQIGRHTPITVNELRTIFRLTVFPFTEI